ncbi:MAG: phosphatase PAP2 family protein [Herminiimonas sp.]|nr:phosphatase PAP2 family protein [Herminiimonas sp.]
MKPLTSTVARRFIAARLSPEGWLGMHLTIGLIALLLTGWLFAEIAEDVVHGDKITLIDVQLATWFHTHATPFFTSVMLAITHMHGTTGILLMALLAGVYLKRIGERYWLMTLIFAVVGGVVLNVLLKHVFQRARPLFDVPILTLDTYSFPSGHVAGSTAFYGVLAAFLLSRPSSGMTKVLIIVGACMMVLLVGLSRMYLGVHYLSDVMAAMMSASAWLALCITGVSTLRRHRLQGMAP